MEVFAVTIFMSLLFAVLFAVLFFAERSQNNRTGIEQMALLPLDDGNITPLSEKRDSENGTQKIL
jgi:cbb3-type cytochrome oxidase subunit 3